MSLFMPRIEANYSAADMIDAFYTSGIATLSRVAYKPYVVDNTLYFRAYVNISEWHDNESAYNFITRLKDQEKETRFIYQEENWFVVRIDPKPWLLDLTLCVVTKNHLLDDVDIDDRSGFMGLQPIDSDWEDINATVKDALNDFNDELYPEDDVSLDYSDDEFDDDYTVESDPFGKGEKEMEFDYSHISDDDIFDCYSIDEEYEEELRIQDFEQDAREWYDERMELKEKLSPSKFRALDKNKTKTEYQYELYLKTGNVVI